MMNKLSYFASKQVMYQFRTFSTSSRMNALKVENLLIIGSGLMGSGIAQSSAMSGAPLKSIVIQDVDDKVLDKAKSRMQANLVKLKKKNAAIDEEKILSQIDFKTKPEPKSTDNLLIIEAVTENLTLKQKLFKSLNDEFGSLPSVIFATNTSSLSCVEIAKHVRNIQHFAGLHFFNPVPLMKLVEIVRLPTTNDGTYNALVEYCKAIGKTPVTCKDTPGFIVNRLLIPYLFEAIAMLERGDATARDIDTAMKLGCGYPMGPFELLDYVGLDTSKFIADGWSKKGAGFISSSKLLNNMVEEGRLGKKSGKGFYDY